MRLRAGGGRVAPPAGGIARAAAAAAAAGRAHVVGLRAWSIEASAAAAAGGELGCGRKLVY